MGSIDLNVMLNRCRLQFESRVGMSARLQGQGLPAPVAGVSSSQAAGDTAPEPPKVLLPTQSSFYDAEKKGATARWLAAQALMGQMD